MRILLPTLLLAAFATSPFAQDPVEDQQPEFELATSSDWDQLLEIYKAAHGGAERYDGVDYLSFDWTVFNVDPETGEEVPSNTRKVQMRFRDDPDRELVRALRIDETVQVLLDGESRDVELVTLLTETELTVHRKLGEGEYQELTNSQDLLKSQEVDGKALFAQLDLLLFLDSRDLRGQYRGMMKRDGEQYIAVEASFRPGRAVPEPSRLYFDTSTALIERVDIFDPKTKRRTGTTRLEGYKDHDGVKFPERFVAFDREMEKLGGWQVANFEINAETPEEVFLKP